MVGGTDRHGIFHVDSKWTQPLGLLSTRTENSGKQRGRGLDGVLGVAGFRQLPEFRALCDRRLRCCELPPVFAALSSAEPYAQSLAGVFVLPRRREAQQLVSERRRWCS